MAMDHVVSFAKRASQMQMSVAIGPYGSYDPIETPKPLWGSPGAELRNCLRGPLFSFAVKQLYTDTHCVTALQSYTANSYTSLYIVIHRYTLYSYTSLYTIQPLQHPSALKSLNGGRI